MREVAHHLVVDSFPSAFLYGKKGGLDVRERSEFPQYQTYQCSVRVVVLGVVGFCPLSLKNTGLA